jgi:lambda repressor-like predicted transcriptional regulator
MSKGQYWQQLLNDWKESGTTLALCCVKSGIKPNTLHYWRRKLSMPMAKTEKLIPIRLHSAPLARVLLGSEVTIELPVESIAGLLQALKDKGLLHAAP